MGYSWLARELELQRWFKKLRGQSYTFMARDWATLETPGSLVLDLSHNTDLDWKSEYIDAAQVNDTINATIVYYQQHNSCHTITTTITNTPKLGLGLGFANNAINDNNTANDTNNYTTTTTTTNVPPPLTQYLNILSITHNPGTKSPYAELPASSSTLLHPFLTPRVLDITYSATFRASDRPSRLLKETTARPRTRSLRSQ